MSCKQKLLDSLPQIKLSDIISSIKIHKKEQEIKKIINKGKKKDSLNIKKDSF